MPERLDEQLDLQGRGFLYRRNFFQIENKRATLSKIFDWFGSDFGANQSERLRFLAAYAPPEVAASLRNEPEKWKLDFAVYDWGLNVRPSTP